MLSKEIKTKILGQTCIEFSEINSTQKYIHSKIKENNIRKAYTITFNILKRILLRLLKFSISTPNLL